MDYGNNNNQRRGKKSATGVMVPLENPHRDANMFKNVVSVLPTCPYNPNAQMVSCAELGFKGKMRNEDF